jgi:glutamine synthetase type III
VNYNYFVKVDNNRVEFLQSSNPVEMDSFYISIKDEEVSAPKYARIIKYIECCTFNDKNEIEIDTTKVLARKLASLEHDVNDATDKLRELVREAAAMDKTEVAKEIAEMIRSIDKFLEKADFSNVTNIDDIENIVCTELMVNYESYFFEKIYDL